MKYKYFNRQLYFNLFFSLAVFGEVNAQFDSLMFLDAGYYLNESVIYMGDQNDDDCDDFIICKMDSRDDNWGYAHFFYGGNPISGSPAFQVRIYHPLLITSCDLNRDGYRDIVNIEGWISTRGLPLQYFYGGPDLDSVPDMQITFQTQQWLFTFRGGVGLLILTVIAGKNLFIQLIHLEKFALFGTMMKINL
ncbi:MAG: hypothetical protein IPN18_02845 [Ignavibacteriales bacterium]|nr:hypothetical protein [Ignavibacteriales bacterium]